MRSSSQSKQQTSTDILGDARILPGTRTSLNRSLTEGRPGQDSEVAATVRCTCFTKSWVGQVARALQLTGMR